MTFYDNASAVIYIQHVIDSTLSSLQLHNVSVVLDESLPCGKGFTQTCSDASQIHTVIKVCIGIAGLSKEGVNADAIFAAVKTAYHEIRHIYQEMQHVSDTDDRAYKMAICYVARLAVPEYYTDKWNYYHCLKELDAEYYALSEARYAFMLSWGYRIANRQLLDYINNVIKNRVKSGQPWYFIPVNEYKSVREVMRLYNEAIDACINIGRNVGFLNAEVYAGIEHISPGFQQDEFIVRQYLKDKPELRAILEQNTPALKRLDSNFP